MSSKTPTRVIYIGSIPYDQTEEQVMDIAKSIGPVVNLTLMFDKDTGRSKGFAFVEYNDVETASSAVRNLNDYPIGNRMLKCDFASESSIASGGGNGDANGKHSRRDELPPLPSGIDLREGQSFAESVSMTLKSLDPQRLQTVVQDAIAMSKRNPVLMEQLLAQCPQLSYALVEALLITKKSSEDAIAQILINNGSSIKNDKEPEQAPVQEVEVLDEEKIALIKQVIAIPDEQIVLLPEEQRAAIIEIKQNYANGVYGTQI